VGWVHALALLLLGAAAQADPVAVPHVIPLSGTGTYVLGWQVDAAFDYGHGFTSIEEIRIDWTGNVTPGTRYSSTSGYFSCTTVFTAIIDEPPAPLWSAHSSGSPFDAEVPFETLGDPSTYFLRNGSGMVSLYLSSIVVIDGYVVSSPVGELTDVNLVIVGVASSPTCGDGVLDELEFCDDGNLDPGDGCDDLCDVENFYTCSGEPSVCVGSEVGILEVLDREGLGDGKLFVAPKGVTSDASGNVYVAASSSNNVIHITPDDTATELLNVSSPGPLGFLIYPKAVVLDTAGNLYVAEGSLSSFNQVFKRAPDGTLSVPIDSDGDGGANPLGAPRDLAADASGNVYVSGAIVFRIAPDESLSILIDETGDGTHGLSWPRGPAFDAAGNAYVAGQASRNVFHIDTEGTVTEILDETANGSGFPLVAPRGIAVGGDGTVYVLDHSQVLALYEGGAVAQILGPDGDGMGNTISGGSGIALGPTGKLYVCGASSNNAFEIDLPGGGTVSEIIDVNGDGIGNGLENPAGIAVTPNGVVYVTGSSSYNLFKIVLEESSALAVPVTSPTALLALMVGFLLSGGAFAAAIRRH
jgi:cysteine-rich repeat protein